MTAAFLPCPKCGKLAPAGKLHDCHDELEEAVRVADMALASHTMADIERAAVYYERQFRRTAKRAEEVPATKQSKRGKLAGKATIHLRNAIFYRRFWEDYADSTATTTLARDLEEPLVTLERWREAVIRLDYAAKEGATHPARVGDAVRVGISPRAVGR